MSQHPSTIALIPARMGSSRFPGKPMAPILGRPMIEHVFERVSGHPLIDEVVVATCDAEIFDHISAIGGRAVMTSDRHERASDRCAEALLAVEAELVLAKKMLEKILARTAGTGMPTFPPYEPASNEAEKEISSIMKMNANIATDMEKATAKLASMMPTKL